MKTFCSLLLCLFVSAASPAEMGVPLKITRPPVSQPKVPLAIAMRGNLFSRWDKNSQTYRLTDHWGIGTEDVSKRQLRGDPVALKYNITKPLAVTFLWAQRSSNPNYNIRTIHGELHGPGESVWYLRIRAIF